jgi:hypothetical protein
MAEELFMFGITAGVFVIFTTILFGVRTKRNNLRIEGLKQEKNLT